MLPCTANLRPRRPRAPQERLIDAFMDLYWERVAPLWRERAELLSALQSRAQGSSGGGSEAGGSGGAPPPRESLVSRLEALQAGLALLHSIFGLTFAGSIVTSWQLGQGIALAHPFVPSFHVVDQGLRELRAARAAIATRPRGSGTGLVFHVR